MVDKILNLDKSRLELIQKSESLKEIRNTVSDEIAAMKKNKEDTSGKIGRDEESF